MISNISMHFHDVNQSLRDLLSNQKIKIIKGKHCGYLHNKNMSFADMGVYH